MRRLEMVSLARCNVWRALATAANFLAPLRRVYRRTDNAGNERGWLTAACVARMRFLTTHLCTIMHGCEENNASRCLCSVAATMAFATQLLIKTGNRRWRVLA
jgi:hypothetical protein